MRKFKTYRLDNVAKFKTRLLNWASKYKRICFLDSNRYKNDSYTSNECIIAAGAEKELIANENAFDLLQEFYNRSNDWLFGFLSYDLKNQMENLTSNNFDGIKMPLLHFFQPKYLFLFRGTELKIGLCSKYKNEADEIFNEILSFEPTKDNGNAGYGNPIMHPRISREEYLGSVEKIKSHIKRGDIYEINFCQEFYARKARINPLSTFLRLNEISQSPFSCYYRLGDKYLLSASPERFMKKVKNKIISQPVKGTAKRGVTKEEDKNLKQLLAADPKEKNENVMIVDIVRNDLSKSALKGSVKVEELFGIYTFRQVHQMISTLSAEVDNNARFSDIIRNAFPMGSMTGAPKIRAMELIEQYEKTKRGLYSGAVGYITPGGDFDFNVVIRSMLYNEPAQYLSFSVGSAITDKASPEKEHEECLLKAKAMFEVIESL